MSDVKLSTTKNVRDLIEGVIREGVKSALHQRSLQEKEKQAALSGGTEQSGGGDNSISSLFGPDDSEGGEGEQEQPSKTGDDEADKLKTGEVETKDIVEKLNSIRSGKSFKDDHVKGSMEQYIESLSKAEKTALFAFLKGIAQIVTGEIPAQQAAEPTKKPADVQMQKGTKTQTKSIKPNVIKGQAPKAKGGGGAEDTSAPVTAPITAKKR